MNFFKSILADDPDPPIPEKSQESEPNSPRNTSQEADDDQDEIVSNHLLESPNADSITDSSAVGGTSSSTAGGVWSFGGFIKTFTTRSESVLETYRRDLQEFGSGLRKETEIIREVASRAVKDLPASIEVGASVAHGSLESVSHAIDGVIKSTAEIISHGKETIVSSSDVESDTPDTNGVSGSGRYNRFDAQLNAIQNDINTFCKEPEDFEEYKKWESGFVLEEKTEEVENLIGENRILEGIYKRVVPNVVDIETFWCRYFYGVHKLRQQERVRANLVKRAISTDDEEELSWDVDDDDDNLQEKNVESKGDELEKNASGEPNPLPVAKQENTSGEPQNSSSAAVNKNEEDESIVDNIDKRGVVQSSVVSVSDVKAKLEESSQASNEGELLKEGDQGESGKHSDVSVVSNQQSVHEEDDFGWDEIEDIGSGDEKKANSITHGENPNRADMRKRLSAAEDDEDFSWGIENDD